MVFQINGDWRSCKHVQVYHAMAIALGTNLLHHSITYCSWFCYSNAWREEFIQAQVIPHGRKSTEEVREFVNSLRAEKMQKLELLHDPCFILPSASDSSSPNDIVHTQCDISHPSQPLWNFPHILKHCFLGHYKSWQVVYQDYPLQSLYNDIMWLLESRHQKDSEKIMRHLIKTNFVI